MIQTIFEDTDWVNGNFCIVIFGLLDPKLCFCGTISKRMSSQKKKKKSLYNEFYFHFHLLLFGIPREMVCSLRGVADSCKTKLRCGCKVVPPGVTTWSWNQ